MPFSRYINVISDIEEVTCEGRSKTFSLFCKYAQDKNYWRFRLTWKMAIEALCVCVSFTYLVVLF